MTSRSFLFLLLLSQQVLRCFVNSLASQINSIAIFVQLDENKQSWDTLSSCIKNVAKARRMAQSRGKHISQTEFASFRNISIDIYVTHSDNMDANYRKLVKDNLSMITALNHVFILHRGGMSGDNTRKLTSLLHYAAIAYKSYDLVLELHSTDDLKFLKYAVQCLCGTWSQVLSVLNSFYSQNKLDMIAPHGTTFGPHTNKTNILPLLVEKYFAQLEPKDAFSEKMVLEMKRLYFEIFGKYLDMPHKELLVVSGSMFWIRHKELHPHIIRKAAGFIESMHASNMSGSIGIDEVIERLIPSWIRYHGGVIGEMIPAPKIMALYFPQYHAIPENDRFWGQGFTEWTLLRKANYSGFLKPLDVSNGGLGYYNLTSFETRKRQAQLAREAGVHAFVIYHYWFSGKHAPAHHKVLYRIPELMLRDGQPDIPFMFSWANEPWSRRWDGTDNEILLSQDYGDEKEWTEHFEYLYPFFAHKRYVRINGKPALALYRIGHLGSKLQPMLKLWNELALKKGLSGLYIINTLGGNYNRDGNTAHLLQSVAEVSASFHFCPHYQLDFPSVGEVSVSDAPIVLNRLHPQYWCAFSTGFDSRVRRPNHFQFQRTPAQFRNVLAKSFAAMQVSRWKYVEENYYFIMAWNEWNEQAILEPDHINGFGHLIALRDTLVTLPPRLAY